jgi:DNA topoisomerase-2
MDDSLMDDSVIDEGASSDFAPAKPVKAAKAAKPKAAPKKAAGPPKPRGRPAKDPAAAPKPRAKAPPKKKPKDDSGVENSDIDMGDAPLNDDESLLADTPPKAKKAPAPKKAAGKPLEDIVNESFGTEELAKAKKAAGGASAKFQMVSTPMGWCARLADSRAVDPFGAHHEAP